jgi:hypothetical protein
MVGVAVRTSVNVTLPVRLEVEVDVTDVDYRLTCLFRARNDKHPHIDPVISWENKWQGNPTRATVC